MGLFMSAFSCIIGEHFHNTHALGDGLDSPVAYEKHGYRTARVIKNGGGRPMVDRPPLVVVLW
jgi:hypothetical protein